MALTLPVVVIMVLGAVDFAQVLSAQQRLERAAHLATLRLLNHPSLNTPSALQAFIAAESGLAAASITAGATYALGSDNADQVVVTATYRYPLLTPGLRNLQTQSINNNTFLVSVSAASVAATSAPAMSSLAPATVKVSAPGDITVPSGLAANLTCILTDGTGATVQSGACPLTVSSGIVSGATYTGTVRQLNGVLSPPAATTAQ